MRNRFSGYCVRFTLQDCVWTLIELLCRPGEAQDGETDEDGDDSESVRRLARYRVCCALLTTLVTAGPRNHS